MTDVFGGLAGGPAGRSDLSGLEHVLEGAALWGLEIDPRFRVLAATFEPTADRYPWDAEADDRRIQVLCFPVSTILASVRRENDEVKELLAFEEEQLVDVVAAFGGAPVEGPLFGQPEPRPGTWGPRYSLEGRSSAPDGISHTLTVHAWADDLQLSLFARFDDIEVKDRDGRDLDLPA